MRGTRFWQALGITVTMAVTSVASADGDQCYLHREMPIERQLRRLSIDLRATVPDVGEYALVDGQKALPDEVIDAYLDSDEFRVQMRRYHESLLWTNPSTALSDVSFSLGSTNLGNGVTVFHVTSTGKLKQFRGGDGTHVCQNKPQAQLGYDPVTGMPNAEPIDTDAVGPYVAEGWVDVHPYWEPDPAKTIKVCAFDAQTTLSYTLPAGDPDAGTYSCDTLTAASKAKSCGCGPELNFCINTGVVQPAVLSSMREQLLRLVDDHTGGKYPYSELVTTKRAYINGPLTHYFRYLAQRQGYSRTQNFHQPSDGQLPELDYTEADNWVEIQRDQPHAGILTLPAYLLRFQTNRGRANRYRIAFEGQYFQPPSTKDTGCKPEGDDLTDRCVCRGCHVLLEPMAAHFGQFTEAGSASLADFVRSYASLKQCSKADAPASTAYCQRFYEPVPDPNDPDIRPYKLKALHYADAYHPEIQPHFDEGPLGLAKKDIESGIFHEVATRHMFEFLMKREANLDPTSYDYEGELLSDIAKEFQAHDNLKLLVKRLVKLETYRRMP